MRVLNSQRPISSHFEHEIVETPIRVWQIDVVDQCVSGPLVHILMEEILGLQVVNSRTGPPGTPWEESIPAQAHRYNGNENDDVALGIEAFVALARSI